MPRQHRHAAAPGQGIRVLGSGDNTIEGNAHRRLERRRRRSSRARAATGCSTTRSAWPPTPRCSSPPARTTTGSRATTLTDSEGGIVVEASNGNPLVGNSSTTSSRLRDRRCETANGTLVRGNDLRFNAGGIELERLDRQPHRGQQRQRDRRRRASRSATARCATSSCGNIANANDGEGIAVDAIAAGRIGQPDRRQHDERQRRRRHQRHGARPHDRRQHANNNGGLGHLRRPLGTVAGVNVDGGGNRAIGNVGGGVDPETGASSSATTSSATAARRTAADPVRPGHVDHRRTGRPDAPDVGDVPLHRLRQRHARSTFECRLDSPTRGAFAAVHLAGHPCTGLALGEHTFEVRAVDCVGQRRRDAGHAHLDDRGAPARRPAGHDDRLAAPDATTVATAATFTFASNEPSGHLRVPPRRRPFAPCTSPRRATPASRSARTRCTVRAIDAEGSSTPTPAAYDLGRHRAPRSPRSGQLRPDASRRARSC